jgi:hypothetical protein
MAELSRELRELAMYVELPPDRELWPGVEARLARRPRRSWRRSAVVALVAALVAVGIAFVVPPARSGILRFLGLEGVSVVRVDQLPPVHQSPVVVGRRTTLAEAERTLGFRPLQPDVGRPDALYFDPLRQALLLVYGQPLRLRLEETRIGIFQKFVSAANEVDRVRVGKDPGIWIEGPHVFTDFFSQPRLAGNTLLWQDGDVTLRLDGRLTKAQAIEIARSVR